MKNRRRLPAVFLLIVFLGGLCGVYAADSGIRSPFSGKKIQQVEDVEASNTSSSGPAQNQSVTSEGMGSGGETETQLKELKELKEKTVTVLTNTLRAIIDLLRQLIEMLKKLLVGKTVSQTPQPASDSTATAVSADAAQPATEPPSDQSAGSEPVSEPEPVAEPAATPEPAPDQAQEQPAVTDSSVKPEPSPEPSVEPPADAVEPAPLPETPRGPTPAECDRMRLLIMDGKVGDAAAMFDKGFDINARIGEKGTALHYAVEAGQKGIVELLLKRGANLDVRDDRNTTPLHIAAATKNVDLCRLLLEAGADVNIAGCEGTTGSDRTPLHIATEWGAVDVIRLLIAKGANVNALDSRKQTPLAWAMFSGQTEAAAILREHGGVVEPSKITPTTSSPAAPATP